MAQSDMRVTYDEGHFYVALPYALNHLLDELPEKRWQKRGAMWKVPANWRSAPVLLDKCGGFKWTDAAIAAAESIDDAPPQLDKPLDPSFLEHVPFIYEPFAHQKDLYCKAYNQDAFAVFFEQGLGKTKSTIDMHCMWKDTDKIDASVIFCPVSIRQVWVKEWATHSWINADVQMMNPQGKISWKDDHHRVLICGIESLSQGRTFESLLKLLPSLGRIAGALDESSRAKNHKAKRTERLVEVFSSFTRRWILTGTPVTQGMEDLYSQFQVINPALISLTSYYAFRNRYCQLESIRGAPPGAVKIVGYKNVNELMKLIEPWSLRREKEDCLDLPEKTFEVRRVQMTSDQTKAYKELKEYLWTQIGEDKIEVQSVLEAYTRLQQITGGFYPVPKLSNKNGKEVITYEQRPLPGSNPKLNELMQTLGDMNGRKVIVWVRFLSEVSLIEESLTKEGVNFAVFHGGKTEDEKKEAVDAFQGGGASILVATYAAAYGLTLTDAHTAVYFSLDFSLEKYLQSQDRIHRIGQTISCSYILLACGGTVDDDVVEALQNKKSLADVVSDRIKSGEVDRLL